MLPRTDDRHQKELSKIDRERFTELIKIIERPIVVLPCLPLPPTSTAELFGHSLDCSTVKCEKSNKSATAAAATATSKHSKKETTTKETFQGTWWRWRLLLRRGAERGGIQARSHIYTPVPYPVPRSSSSHAGTSATSTMSSTSSMSTGHGRK